MPTSPKIPKELILKESLELLIAEGYENVNIKTIAKKIGCSTQPISWHFKNMDGLRSALSEYALIYANSLMEPSPTDETPFDSVGKAFVKIAFEKPNLYKFLYLDGGSKYSLGGLRELELDTGNEEIAEHIAKKFNKAKQEALDFVLDVIIYTNGILSLVVSNVLKLTQDEVLERLKHICESLLN